MTISDTLMVYFVIIFSLLYVYVLVWLKGPTNGKLSGMIRRLARERRVERNRAKMQSERGV